MFLYIICDFSNLILQTTSKKERKVGSFMLRNNYFGETKTHYKLYKCGKNWAVMGISLFSLGLGMLVTSRPVSANVPNTSTSSSPMTTETPSASSSSPMTTETPSASSSSPMTPDEAALAHVDKDNFLEYFRLNGSATYDAKTRIVTITPDQNNQVGNFSLTSKIDMNNSFTLTGQVNLGSNPNGADGIGFAFHSGNTTDVGIAGGNLGIGGLQDAIGFKLDTFSIITKYHYQIRTEVKSHQQILMVLVVMVTQ